MIGRNPNAPGSAKWWMGEIPFDAIDRDLVEGNELLFHAVACASFVEITSDLYTRNLVEFFRGDAEVVRWLEEQWEKEEVHHGLALKRYVQAVWPDFDWETAYRGFFAEYRPLCSIDQYEDSRTLEMAARCVVETGTSSYYRMLAAASPEPVLARIATSISADELRHFKYFYRFFRKYRGLERPSRRAVLRTLFSRATEIDTEDAFYAFKHVFLTRHPGAEFGRSDYAAFRAGLRRLASRHFPQEMATKMMLKPLDLSGPVERVVVPAIASTTRLLLGI